MRAQGLLALSPVRKRRSEHSCRCLTPSRPSLVVPLSPQRWSCYSFSPAAWPLLPAPRRLRRSRTMPSKWRFSASLPRACVAITFLFRPRSVPWTRACGSRRAAPLCAVSCRPAAVKVTSKVAVMQRLVTRGSAIGAGDIGLELRELGTAQTYLRDPAQLIGKMAKRSLAAGVAVTPEMVAAPLLVRRVQQVVIVANIPGVEVRMQGRKQLSKRIVEATGVDVGVAQVAM